MRCCIAARHRRAAQLFDAADSFRASTSADEWIEVARALVQIVPVIMIDASGFSDHVVEEMEMIERTGNAFKTLILSDLEVPGAPRGSALLNGQSLRRIVLAVRALPTLPNPNQTIADIVEMLG